MKLLSLVFFLFVSLSASAQRHLIRQSVEDDGRKLVVEFDIEQRTGPLAFRRTYDVKGWSKNRKQALLREIVQSLHLPREVADVALLDEEVPSAAEPISTAAVSTEAGSKAAVEAAEVEAAEEEAMAVSIPAEPETPEPAQAIELAPAIQRELYQKSEVPRASGCSKNCPRKAPPTSLP